MTLEPVLRAPLAVQIHVATVLPAFLIGTFQIFVSRKGSAIHRAFGYIYLALMNMTAISTLWVHQLMPHGPLLGFSPIHLLIPLVMFGTYSALRGAWTHDVQRHKWSMIGVYVGGILIAGGLTLLPGRIMYAVVFGH